MCLLFSNSSVNTTAKLFLSIRDSSPLNENSLLICSPSGHSIFFFFSGAVNIFSWNLGPWWNQRLPTFENKQSISRNTKLILIYRDDILRSYTAKWSVFAINWRLSTTLLTVIQWCLVSEWIILFNWLFLVNWMNQFT